MAREDIVNSALKFAERFLDEASLVRTWCRSSRPDQKELADQPSD